MNNDIFKYLVLSCILISNITNIWGQDNNTVAGKVYDANNRSVLKNVRIYSPDGKTVLTDSTGTFRIDLTTLKTYLTVTADSYVEKNIMVNDQSDLRIYLSPTKGFMAHSVYETSEGTQSIDYKTGSSVYLNKQDFSKGYTSAEDPLVGRIAGMKVLNKSGMPGEGSFVQMRGIRTLLAENTPLIVLDGVPFLPNTESSAVIGGFSRSIFSLINLKNIESMTLLKGMDAAAYGSMASNGVLLIQTERSKATETEMQLNVTGGVGYHKRKFPLLKDLDFKNYIANIGETAMPNLNELMETFPFLEDDPNSPKKYLYNNNTDWQKEIYRPTVVSEVMLKVMGGDAIASYALAVGYMQNKGIIENTNQTKYNTRLNADVNVSNKLTILANAALNYSEYDLQEMGMNNKTNPLLAALDQAPILSVKEQDRDKNDLPHFNPTVGILGISNPAAIVSDMQATDKSYDVLINLGFNYKFKPYLKFNGTVGVYYSYSQEKFFAPGLTSGAIAFLEDGLSANTMRESVSEGTSYYAKLAGDFNKSFDHTHTFDATLGYQLISSKREVDWGTGLGNASDFYTVLDNVNPTYGRKIGGYLDKWNWMDVYLKAKYGYKEQLYASIALTADAATPYGKNHGRVVLLPTSQLAWKMKNSSFLQNIDLITDLTLRAEYGMSANSRFSSKYGRYYYQSVSFGNVAGMVRSNLPNSNIGPEKVLYGNLGLDFSMLGNRLNMSANLFEERTKDMLLDKGVPSAYGKRYMHSNDGELKTRGVELSLDAKVYQDQNFTVMVGGTISHHKTTVESLGGLNEKIYTLNNGAVLISRVGEAPYSYYGTIMDGVFITQNEADEAKYVSQSGQTFEAGDVRFRDIDNNHIIDDADRVNLGSAAPDFYGGFYTNVGYKNFNLFVNFSYSYGSKIYNAVRRHGESMSRFSNQFATVKQSWKNDGQQTTMPIASYGDPMQNSRFSSRWIDDGSFVRMKEITLSYNYDRKLWFFNNIQLYLTGENLYTWTKYIGLDPEFSYSYDPMLSGMDLGKAPIPRTFKLGAVLNF